MIYYLVLAFFVVEYMRPGNMFPPLNALRLNTVIPLAMLVGTSLSGKVSNGEILRERNMLIFATLMVLVIGSVVTARVTMYAFTAFTVVLGYVLLTWVVARQMGDIEDVKGLFKTLMFIHLGIIGIAPELVLDGQNRNYIPTGAFLGDGNDFALSIDILVPFCLFMIFDAKGLKGRLFWAATLLVLVAAVIGTQSRGGTLGMVAVAIYYWTKTDRKVLTAALAVVAVVGVLGLASPQYFERMNTLSHVEDDGSAQGRITAWTAGTNMMLSNPLLGVGAGNFPPNFPRFAPGAGGIGPWKTAHSIYFLILGELGLPGIMFLLYFIFWNLYENRRLTKEVLKRGLAKSSREVRLVASLSASLLAFAVAGAFLSAIYYPHMYVLAGLLIATRRIARLAVAQTAATDAATSAGPVLVQPSLRPQFQPGRYVS
jgi:putative inorganic carbon (hco3(-)) transporter